MNAQKKKFDDMFNAMMNGIETTPKQTTTTTTAATTGAVAARTKPLPSVEDSIFANFDMDEFAPSKKQPAKPANGLAAAKKDPLDDLFQDELFAGILNNTNNTASHAGTNTNIQPSHSKSKPLVKKNSISGGGGGGGNRYDDLFSGLANPQKPTAAGAANPKDNNNMDWLGGLEYEGSFLTREEAGSTKGGGGLRRSRFIPSGKRDGNSATNGKNAGGGWTQTTFKINSGPLSNQQTSPVVAGGGGVGSGSGAGYVPSFATTTTNPAAKPQADKKSMQIYSNLFYPNSR